MSPMMQTILEILIPVLASVLTALSAVAIRKLQKRFDLELSDQQNEMLKKVIRDGIASAEEWAARKAKLNDGATVRGREKAVMVTNLVKAAYPKLTESEIGHLIDAEIARTEGLGSTGKKISV
jgi:Na+-translocating ferredoxin:NAD+ oxidoreductase RnfG subunit